MTYYELFYALICLHFLLDYPLQGDFIGKFKNRHAHGIGHKFFGDDTMYKCDYLIDPMHNSPASDPIYCRKTRAEHIINVGVPWWHLMAAHAFIQSGGVFLLTGHLEYAITELVIHFYVDVQKCENKININTDQFLHIACKAAYVAIMMYRGQI